jgi:hypothetical protein
MTQANDIQKLIQQKSRRLQLLQEQEAVHGINIDPAVVIQIEDLEDELADLRRQLAAVPPEPASSSVAPNTAQGGQNPSPVERETTLPVKQSQIGGFNFGNISGSTITIGNIVANVSAGGDVVGGDKITTAAPIAPDSGQAQLAAALIQWQQQVEAVIATLEDDDEREFGQKTAAKTVDEAQKGQAADPAKIEGWLNKLSHMAPDILEVTATTLQNPFKGVGLVLQKINDRIKLEREK